MSLNIKQSPQLNIPQENTERNDQNFNAVIERMKIQKALPHNIFGVDFDPSNNSVQSQIKLLFESVNDMNFYTVFKNIIALPDDNNSELVHKRLSGMQIMSFAQLILYKVFPCPEKECANCPRDVVIKNQYKDYEYECPFYHNEKDRRRLVLTPKINEEFIYKANYFEEKKHEASEKEKCSSNYFESMFHPLYYKMFRCKREHCNFSLCCPFYHTEEEKKAWDRTFGNFIRKDRISYVKEKQKYFESKNTYNNNYQSKFTPKPTTTTANNEVRFLRAGVKNSESTCDSNNNETSSPLSGFSTNSNSRKQNYRPKNNFAPILTQPMQGECVPEKGFKSSFFRQKDWANNEKQIHIKNNDEGEVGTPSTGTSGRGWKNSNKPLC